MRIEEGIFKRDAQSGIKDRYRIGLPADLNAVNVTTKYLKGTKYSTKAEWYGDEIGFDNKQDRDKAFDILYKVLG